VRAGEKETEGQAPALSHPAAGWRGIGAAVLAGSRRVDARAAAVLDFRSASATLPASLRSRHAGGNRTMNNTNEGDILW